MRKILIGFVLTVASVANLEAQNRIFTKSGTISFHAGTAVEDIDGVNKSVTSIIDVGTGQVEFAVLMKGFEFKRSLMQDHFNENYVESAKYPKAFFKGQITDPSAISLSTDGTYPVTIKGTLEIHGVKKDVEASGKLIVSNGAVTGDSDLTIALEDYKIQIPGAVADKISPIVKIHVACNYKPL